MIDFLLTPIRREIMFLDMELASVLSYKLELASTSWYHTYPSLPRSILYAADAVWHLAPGILLGT